jgi:hypothetical protein
MDPFIVDLDQETLDDIDPFLRFITASGEVNFEYPDPPTVPDNSVSTVDMPASTAGNAAVYETARASRPLLLMGLPQDVRKKIYAMVLGPPTVVEIRSIRQPPHLQDSIDSPTNLFLVSRKVYREAASVFYGATKFHLQTEWGIGYMTASMGLDNCREIRDFTTYKQFVWNIALTLRTFFPQLETLTVLPEQDWFCGPWFDFMHSKHHGCFQAAIDEAVITSRTTAAFGLKELLEMSKHYYVVMMLPFWNNANTTRTSIVVSIPE